MPPALKKEMARMEKRNRPEVRAKEISGTVTVAPSLRDRDPRGVTLFIVARPQGQDKGPPLAVKRYDAFRLPFEFSIGPADVMLDDMPFEGPLTLLARVDQDGNAMAGPGDFEGTVSVQPGDKNVALVLDKQIPPEPGGQISGTLDLSAALRDKAPGGATLFIVARKQGVGRGAPLAVIRVDGVTFPYRFTIGQQNVMLPGARFAGAVDLLARLDQDGVAGPSPGDLEGRITAKAGDTGVPLLLNTVFGD